MRREVCNYGSSARPAKIRLRVNWLLLAASALVTIAALFLGYRSCTSLRFKRPKAA